MSGECAQACRDNHSLWPAVARAAPGGDWVGSLWLRCATIVSLAEVSGSAAGTISLVLRGLLKLGEPQEQPRACNSHDSG